MPHLSTKTYGHNIGLACVFRQPNADHSHCHLLHGYSLQFKFTFGCKELDERNWVQDFGGLKTVKQWLKNTFDHTLCVAEDDPELDRFKKMHEDDVVDLRILPAVGCEKFAE